MAPNPRPIPRFIADTTQEGIPHGRFSERLATAFGEAVGEIEDLPEGAALPEAIDWFPERAWGGRTWVPCSAYSGSEEGKLELFGHVSYVQPPGGEPPGSRPNWRNCEPMYSAAIRSKTVPLPRPCIASLARKLSSARMSCSRIACALIGPARKREITNEKMNRGVFIVGLVYPQITQNL